MSFPIKPLTDYVALQAEKKPETTASGIYLTESATEKPDVMTVMAVADNVTTVKAGDKVVTKSYAGTTVKVGDDEYSLVKIEDIMAVLSE